MKICAIICEYNPFHNGHAYHLSEAKRRSGADAVVCIMSGNFVQRGEVAVMEKYARAKHAVLAGADAVLELPAVFSTSSAEIFAKGGVKIANAIGADVLSFGVESGNEEDFRFAAKTLLNEPTTVSLAIKNLLDSGVSFAKARAIAWQQQFPDGFLSSPNNVLGIEYAKAALLLNASFTLLPIERKGGGYLDKTLSKSFSSATAIRKALTEHGKETLSSHLPPFVFEDLPDGLFDGLETAEKAALLSTPIHELASVLDCTEGLENALVREAKSGTIGIAEKLTSKRYTTSRIKRIMLQNLLKIRKPFIEECFKEPLYLNVLAVRKNSGALLSNLSSAYPLLIRAYDENALQGTAKRCREIDRLAEGMFFAVRNQTAGTKKIVI